MLPDQIAVDTIKALAMDAIQRADSGHPGMPMGMADIAAVLWGEYLTVDPDEPEWPDRDRFIVSNGHGSMLLYALLHLSGFPVSLDDLRGFRQWGSPTAGHPEREPHLGIEVTTGPLGQGFGMGVGAAVAEEHLRAVFGPGLMDHRTFALVSDGDLEEGVAAEAASLAGHLRLGRLIYIYDDNKISIEGATDLAFSEDVAGRFDAYGWHTVRCDGHDREAVSAAIAAAIAEEERPSLIIARTHIGHGSPNKQDTAGVHGSPLGEEELALTKAAMGWDREPFDVPDAAYEFFAQAMDRGRAAHRTWEERREAAFAADPELEARWSQYWEPGTVSIEGPEFAPGESMATRKASGAVLNEIATTVPNLIGGSADLAPSTNTLLDGSSSFAANDRLGRNMHFGIREHGMGAAVNGMAAHGGLRPFGATFFVFSDYMRPAVRLAALMEVPSIWVWTHDSVFLGEDGPTHQPIEHLSSLRGMPGMWVVRPADATETREAWELALNRTGGPTALVLTRQGLPVLDRPRGGVARGGYVLHPGDDAVLVATGSEVHVALGAAGILESAGVSLRVVSLPCWEAFFAQDEEYRDGVLGGGLPVASLEAGATFGWERITGRSGLRIGIDHFGASAPASELARQWGFTPQQVAQRVADWLSTVSG